MAGSQSTVFSTRDYDLAGTLDSGQTFRWKCEGGAWTAVIGSRWVQLRQEGASIFAETAEAVTDWNWLTDYLQLDVDFEEIISQFPRDQPLQEAVAKCRGLRVLRQDPWECLASFILSSTKQIVQIRQIVESICDCFGEQVQVPAGYSAAKSFPRPDRIAGLSERELRSCKMGFRAPYLLRTAEEVAAGRCQLTALREMSLMEARQQLLCLPGVGRKIADCVLLFACGFHKAFPVDTWIIRALRQWYFGGRVVKLKELHEFCESYFGPRAGYAQQYLFHYMRTKAPPIFLPLPAPPG